MKTASKAYECPVCQSRLRRWGNAGKFQISSCISCGLGITNRGQLQQSDYHRDEVYIKEEKQFNNIFQRRVDMVRQINPHPKKVLEIGSSTGLMLSLFKRYGAEVLGIEMSAKAAKRAYERDIPTLISPFESARITGKFFDVVVLNHTLEHLPDTKKVLRKINRLMNINGLILIDVPNFGSLSAKIYKEDWPYLLPEEHLWHFTYQALEKALEKSGFEIVKYNTASGVWDYNNQISELWQAFTGFKKRFFNELVTMIPCFFISRLGLGTSLTLLARKKR